MPSTTTEFTAKLAKVLKPVTEAEAERAVKAAVDYLEPELVRDGNSRFRVLGVELAPLNRPKRGDVTPPRRIEVVIIDYLNRRHVRLLVEGRRVVEVRTLNYQPAMLADEVKEAVELAERDSGLSEVAAEHDVLPSPYAPGSRQPGERRIGLRYIRPTERGAAAVVATAEVDLVEQKVLAVRLPGRGITRLA